MIPLSNFADVLRIVDVSHDHKIMQQINVFYEVLPLFKIQVHNICRS